MFSETVEVKRLHPSEVNDRVVNDINTLLKKQRHNVKPINAQHLLSHMKRSNIVVGWSDDRLVAMGALVRTSCLSHDFVSVHNLVVLGGYNVLTIGMSIIQLLIKDVKNAEFVEAGVWLQDKDLEQILKALGFKEKPRSRYRLRLK